MAEGLGAALMLLLAVLVYGEPEPIKIGIVEEVGERGEQLAAAADAALRGGTGDAGGGGAEPAAVAPVEPGEPLAMPRQFCAQAAAGVEAALSGGSGTGAELAAEAAARSGLPLLLPAADLAAPGHEVLQLYPHPELIAKAVTDLVAAKGWTRAVLLHVNSAAPAALLAEPLTVLPRRLPPPGDEALLRNLLLVLKKSGETQFIIWCEAECAARVLDAAQRVGLLAERHAYVVPAPELHTLDLRPFSHGQANITGFLLFDPESEEVQAASEALSEEYRRRVPGQEDEPPLAASTALLLAHQGAALAGESWRRLQLPAAFAADCEMGRAAFHADTLLNYIRSEEWEGVSWEWDGARRAARLVVAELWRGGRLTPAGSWSPRAGLVWARRDPPQRPPPRDSMTNRTFTVLIARMDPYVMRQESVNRLSGNDRYEGYCIELIDRLAQILNFNYTFVELEKGGYGNYNEQTKQWDGMIGQLINDPNIDFAITDLTITAEREKAVDFTTPFMNLGISILFRTPKAPKPEVFAFLLPFSTGVWLCLGVAYLGTSLVLFVTGRLCPEEWQNPHPCVEEPEALHNQFTLANALWFNLGAMLLQGSEIAPVAYGTRAVASVWWLFALVITSSYTANLATLLAKKTSTELIHNVQELYDNPHGITYGAKDGGSTYTFFQNAQGEPYKQMYQKMQKDKMPKSNDEGIKKVMTENYAFLMESTTIEYTIERNCEVTKVGGLLDSKGYGLAMKKKSPYRQALNLALLNLQEAGILREMKHKWWNEKHGGGACKEEDDRENTELTMLNFLGLFLVLAVGCAMGVVLSAADLARGAWRRARSRGGTFRHQFWTELRFVFRFDCNVKPLHGPLLPESSSDSSDGTARSAQSGESAPEPEEPPGRLRSMSLQSAGAGGAAMARRRSSMHAASVRLARHAAPRPSQASQGHV